MGVTVALLLALATAGAPERLPRMPGESPLAYVCRASLIPEGRACASRCEAARPGAAQDEARFGCTLACTQKTLYAMATCRASLAAGAAQAPPLASR
jgi:hypothetical protein